MTPTESTRQLRSAAVYAALRTDRRDRALYLLALATATSIIASIAVSQILLGLSFVALLVSRKRLAFPPIAIPIASFFAWTVLADLFCRNPAGGFPQIRKFFVFAIVPVIYNGFRSVSQIRALIWLWAGFSTLSGILAIREFVHRLREAIQLHAPVYEYVLDGSVSGFASHWMTFGGEQMIVLLMLFALLAFAPWKPRWKTLGWIAAAMIWIGIILGLTRSIFLVGLPCGVLVLSWTGKKWFTFIVPIIAMGLFFISSAELRERVYSVVRPHGDIDSNSRRAIMARTGLRMIASNPWFGVGPEQVGLQFMDYLPPDVHRPLPKGWYGHLHNIYLQYAAERGLPALGCVLWMIAKIAADFRHALRNNPSSETRFVLIGALAVIAAVLAEGFFEHNLGDSEVLTMFLASATCGYVAKRWEEAAAS